MKDDEYHRRALGMYLRKLGHPGPAAWLEVSFAGDSSSAPARVRVARIELELDEGGVIVCSASLGPVGVELHHVHQFVTLFDDPMSEATHLVASLCHYSAFVSPLDEGHTIPLGPSHALRRRGYDGAGVRRVNAGDRIRMANTDYAGGD